MKSDNDKNPAQIMLTKGEYMTVRQVSISRGFSSVNKYLRSLVEADVSTVKRAHPNPWIFGMSLSNWERLTVVEREKYLSQIGTVEPNSMVDFINQKHQHNAFRSKIDNEIGIGPERSNELGL